MNVLTRKDLPTKCDHPGCTCDGELHLRSQCCNTAKLRAVLMPPEGVLVLCCSECGGFVSAFQIADGKGGCEGIWG